MPSDFQAAAIGGCIFDVSLRLQRLLSPAPRIYLGAQVVYMKTLI